MYPVITQSNHAQAVQSLRRGVNFTTHLPAVGRFFDNLTRLGVNACPDIPSNFTVQQIWSAFVAAGFKRRGIIFWDRLQYIHVTHGNSNMIYLADDADFAPDGSLERLVNHDA